MGGISARADRFFSPVSLRKGFALSFGALASLAVVSAAVLLTITLLLHQDSHLWVDATARDQIARDVETDLLLHNQISNMALARGGGELKDLAERQRKAIGDHLQEARKFGNTAVEQAVLSNLDRSVAEYFAAHDLVRAQQMPLSEAVQRTGAALDLVLREVKELQAIAQADVAHARSAGTLMLHTGIAVAVIVAIIIAVGVIIGFVEVRFLLYRPLVALREVIQKFAAGQPSARAEESVPSELKEVAHTFNVMAAKIERQRADELSSLAGIAHDLRNPIAVVGVLTEPTAIERTVQSGDRVRRTLGLVNRQVQRLQRMISDLLDTARIESGQLRLELADCDLREVARAAVDLHEGLSETHNVRLSIPQETVLVRGDAQRLEQVLNNLISNAIKFSPEGGEVLVTVSTADGRATLTVSDDGIGMTAAQQAGIFEPFRRAGPPGIPGAGLGLSVVKRIVDAHAGNIDVESVPGLGSTFRISLSTASGNCRTSSRMISVTPPSDCVRD